MPRQRDYKREYASRISRERERAASEGRPFSRSKARGHTNNDNENARRRVYRKLDRNRARLAGANRNVDNLLTREQAKQAAKKYSWKEVEQVLIQQDASINWYAVGSVAQGRTAYVAGQSTDYDPSFFWYHGN